VRAFIIGAGGLAERGQFETDVTLQLVAGRAGVWRVTGETLRVRDRASFSGKGGSFWLPPLRGVNANRHRLRAPDIATPNAPKR